MQDPRDCRRIHRRRHRAHIIKSLRKPALKKAFTSKGPPSIQKVLAAMPIHLITTPDNALYGPRTTRGGCDQ